MLFKKKTKKRQKILNNTTHIHKIEPDISEILTALRPPPESNKRKLHGHIHSHTFPYAAGSCRDNRQPITLFFGPHMSITITASIQQKTKKQNSSQFRHTHTHSSICKQFSKTDYIQN